MTAGGASSDERESLRRSSRRGRRVVAGVAKELSRAVVLAVVVTVLLRAFGVQVFYIPSASMESTLLEGDRVVVQRITSLRRGGVVTFQDPGDWLRSETSQPGRVGRVLRSVGVPAPAGRGYLIKRVIGLPGDQVVCCDAGGRLAVNGTVLDESSYLFANEGHETAASDVPFSVVVPRDRIFVLGTTEKSVPTPAATSPTGPTSPMVSTTPRSSRSTRWSVPR